MKAIKTSSFLPLKPDCLTFYLIRKSEGGSHAAGFKYRLDDSPLAIRHLDFHSV